MIKNKNKKTIPNNSFTKRYAKTVQEKSCRRIEFLCYACKYFIVILERDNVKNEKKKQNPQNSNTNTDYIHIPSVYDNNISS